MSDTRWVQHVSKAGTKWPVSFETVLVCFGRAALSTEWVVNGPDPWRCRHECATDTGAGAGMTRSRLQEILELVRSRDVDDAAYSDYFSEVVAHDAALREELAQVTGERGQWRQRAYHEAKLNSEIGLENVQLRETNEKAVDVLVFDAAKRLSQLQQQLTQAQAENARLLNRIAELEGKQS